jgi:hypothetical protein
MGFDLLQNAFAILKLGNDASPSAISARARDLGGDRASVASRTLISPRTRLQAELAFLPGLTQDEAQKCLLAVQEGTVPESPQFPALARANLLAHLASKGKATETHLDALANIAASVRGDTLEILNRDRRCAGMPPVTEPMFNAAMEQLESQHAEALSDGALALKNGPEVLSHIVQSLGSSVTSKSVFLRQATSAWERSTASENARDTERTQELETKLNVGPHDGALAALVSLIHSIAARTRPSRELARHFGLAHDASVEVVNKWRCLAVDLGNKHQALIQACSILEVLAEEFGTSDDPGRRVARDLTICRERLEAGEHIPELQRFAAAILAANQEPSQFKNDHLKRIRDGQRSRYDAPVVVRLWNAFGAAARNAPSDWPWRALRDFAIRLHNEFSESEAALLLTDLALEHAYGNQLTNEIRSLFD